MEESHDKREKPGSSMAFVDRAAVVMDPRLADIWAALWERDEACVPMDSMSGLLRLAYLTGYHDCLVEPERGELYRKIGLRIPRRRVKPRR